MEIVSRGLLAAIVGAGVVHWIVPLVQSSYSSFPLIVKALGHG